MTKSIEQLLRELEFDLPSGLVERAVAAAVEDPQADSGLVRSSQAADPSSDRLVDRPGRASDRHPREATQRFPRAAALVAALLAVALVGTLVLAAHQLNTRQPTLAPQPRPPHAELCRTQCNVGAQVALPPKSPVPVPCSSNCAVGLPSFATAQLAWISTGPVPGPSTLYRTDDAGEHWHPSIAWDGPVAQQIRSSADGNEALIVTGFSSTAATLFHTTDRGGHWSAHGMPDGADPAWNIYFVNATEGWTWSPNFDVIHTTDSGAHWTRIGRLVGLSNPRKLVFFSSSVWAYSEAPFLYITHDGGATWSAQRVVQQKVTTNSLITSVKFLNAQDGVLEFHYCASDCYGQADGDYAYTTTDGGRHWSAPIRLPRNSPQGDSEYTSMIPTIYIDLDHWIRWDQAIIVTDQVLYTNDGGRHWHQLPRADSYTDAAFVDFSDPLHGWVLSAISTEIDGGRNRSLGPSMVSCPTACQGSVWETSDGGLSWTQRNVPN